MARSVNIIVWLAALSSLLLGGMLATVFMVMATSLDPIELLSIGAEPWINALIAAGCLVAQVVATLVGLRLWHSERFRIPGAIIVAAIFALSIFGCVQFFAEYV